MSPLPSRVSRRGVALLTALATIVLIAGLSAAVRRDATASSRALARDILVMRHRWSQEGCVAAALALTNASLEERGDTAWILLDREFSQRARALGLAHCNLELRALETTRNVNTIDSLSLMRLFLSAGITQRRSLALTSAVLDWRDPDQVARAEGAEASWYRERRRPVPPDTILSSTQELRLIRGYEDAAFVRDTVSVLLGVGTRRLSGLHAPYPVLRSLSQLSDFELEQWLRFQRESHGPAALAAQPMTAGPTTLALTVSPEAWSVSTIDSLGHTTMIIARAGKRAGVLSFEESP